MQVLKIARVLNQIAEWTGRGIAWLALAMVMLQFAIVLLRYFFDTGWMAMQEAVLYLHALLFLLGASYTIKWNEHVRVDIFYLRFSARTKAIVNALGVLFLLWPVCVFILIASWDYVLESWLKLERSADGNVPVLFVIKSFILVFAVTVILQGLVWILEGIAALRAPAGHNTTKDASVG